jgi:molybdate-binding protein
MQGIVFRKGDKRFEGMSAQEAVHSALADPVCIMVNRNQGAGTRILIDRLLGDARPDGYWNQPRSHNAVAAAMAERRADWGVTIAPVAHASNLGFIPLAEEHYDFALVTARKHRRAVQAFLDTLASDEARAALAKAGSGQRDFLNICLPRSFKPANSRLLHPSGETNLVVRICRICHLKPLDCATHKQRLRLRALAGAAPASMPKVGSFSS